MFGYDKNLFDIKKIDKIYFIPDSGELILAKV